MPRLFKLTLIVPSPLLGPVMEVIQDQDGVQVLEQELIADASAQQGKRRKARNGRRKRRSRGEVVGLDGVRKAQAMGWVQDQIQQATPGVPIGRGELVKAGLKQGLSKSGIQTALNRLTEDDKLIRERRGWYKVPVPVERRAEA